MPQDTNLHKAAHKGQPNINTSKRTRLNKAANRKEGDRADDRHHDTGESIVIESFLPMVSLRAFPRSALVFSLSSCQCSVVRRVNTDPHHGPVAHQPYDTSFISFFLPPSLGDLASVEDLLAQGEDVNSRGAQNRTPLHRAVGKGHNAVVQQLIRSGADLSLLDQGGLTPLSVTTQQ